MCGIAGVVDLRSKRDFNPTMITAMNDSQNHRGPDEDGIWQEPGVALAHKRLSIIDLSSGQQPMLSEDGSIVLVYNGEIYNFPSLQIELKELGFNFRTNCDTEVIIYAWLAWGEKCVERFRGMFAFALWDKRHETLFLARDRLGIKPLFYAPLTDGQLVFGSELKAVLKNPDVSRETLPEAVEDYFHYGYVPEPRTILKSVKKMPPGHRLLLKRGQPVPAPQEYWDVPFTPLPQASRAEYEEELINRLREAVDIRMVAEVPLGAFLSGGVDSGAVVAMMAELQKEPVNTCSIGFSEAAFDESDYAQIVADRYHTAHRTRQVDPNDFDLIDELANLYDEPYADSSAMPTYRVCQMAREQVTVALSGDGGDENLAGYRRYRFHMLEERMRSSMPLAARKPIFGPLGKLYPKLDWAPRYVRGKTTFQAMARDSVQAYAHTMSFLGDDLRNKLYSKNFKRELHGYHASEVLRHHAERSPTDNPLSLIQYLDMKTYLPGDILTKVDRASMAHSLEVRVPLLDHPLVEWISGLPPEMKLRGGEGKYIFKKALEPYLPKDVLYRPKMGFGVPLNDWFKGPLQKRMHDSLLNGSLAEIGMFDRKTLEHIVSAHSSGQREYSTAIWSLMMFESYNRQIASA